MKCLIAPLCFLASGLLPLLNAAEDLTVSTFELIPGWKIANSIALNQAGDAFEAIDSESGTILYTDGVFEGGETGFLLSHQRYFDQVVSFEFMVPRGSQAGAYVHGRYEIKLSEDLGGTISGNKTNVLFDDTAPTANAAKPAGTWQTLQIRFRGLRKDLAENKTDNALFLEVKLNDETVQLDVPIKYYSTGSERAWEAPDGVFGIRGANGAVAIRNFEIRHANYETVSVPETGESSNVADLLDHVDLGQRTFRDFGCIECHTTKNGDTSFKTGPNLYGLFNNTPRKREIAENGTNKRFLIEADRSYMKRSIRHPHDELAISESGANKGEAYLPIMAPFSEEMLSDAKIDAIYSYLSTLTAPDLQGPAEVLVEKSGPKQYLPLEDTMHILVDSRTRIHRGSMKGLSGRSIHVGQTNGINYTFDPRTLSIEKLWQGGFINGGAEWQGRGGGGFTPGFENKEISFGNGGSLLAPLNSKGDAIDFSFKEAKFEDWETINASLNNKRDHLDLLADVNAAFRGYTVESNPADSNPTFAYRVGNNQIEAKATFSKNGEISYQFTGELADSQSFSINTAVFKNIDITAGKIDSDGIWTVPANTGTFSLNATMQVASKAWRPTPSDFNHLTQKLITEPTEAQLPAGYSSEQYLTPKDNYGRDLLFEATGIAVAPDGTIVVATRTSGIWRIVDGEWILFAEGLFDCLGVVVEDEKGLQIVAGQKPELTRITDTDGDGIADRFDTLSDQFSYHSNYHSYMHGPVRDAKGNYYYNLNLLHSDDAIYKGNGLYMGTSGGFTAWTIKITPEGEFIPWANGLRSPAGFAKAPDGRFWYADNQGEYVGTSKLFILEEDGFYGHPAGLVDLPSMVPESPEIQWPEIGKGKKRAVVLLPHNSVANSPGNPAWDTTEGKFGAYAAHMFIGDQTQSKLMRVTTEVVNGIEQGCVIPFGQELQSGIMRPVFLPDGSMLIGQTGRGWQARGGKLASLQRIIWDGETTAPDIHNVSATADGFIISLTQPLISSVTKNQLHSWLTIKSWMYRDAPDYGSPELDRINEEIASITISADRSTLEFKLKPSEKGTHEFQTARVYHIVLDTINTFSENAPSMLEAYYTRY